MQSKIDELAAEVKRMEEKKKEKKDKQEKNRREAFDTDTALQEAIQTIRENVQNNRKVFRRGLNYIFDVLLLAFPFLVFFCLPLPDWIRYTSFVIFCSIVLVNTLLIIPWYADSMGHGLNVYLRSKRTIVLVNRGELIIFYLPSRFAVLTATKRDVKINDLSNMHKWAQDIKYLAKQVLRETYTDLNKKKQQLEMDTLENEED